MITSFIISLVVIVVDQITKHFIYGLTAFSVVGDLLWFESSLNTGVAFSMFEGKSYLFAILAFVAAGVMIWLIASKKFFKPKFQKITLGLILGGTIANAIDRIVFKGVRDFIYLKFINFAIFNVADMAITIGAVLLCVSIVVSMFKKEDTKKEEK